METQTRIAVTVDAGIRGLMPAFLANRKKDLETIRSALAQADFEAIRRIGENMQGCGRGYGLERLSMLGEELRSKAGAEQANEVRQTLRDLGDYLERIDLDAEAGADGLDAAREKSHVLLVEDDELSRVSVTRFLRDHGYAVKHVADGEQALAALERAPLPAVVLLDVVLPGMNGFDVCRRIKADPLTRSTPVVLITSLNGEEDRVRGYEANADDFLTKPLRIKELLTKVRALVRLDEAHRALEEQLVLREADKRQRERRMFERYLSPKVAQLILAGKAGAEASWARHMRRDAVVLFADLRGFTSISEKLDVDHVAKLLNEYFAALTQAAYRYEGSVFNMTGDGLLVGFNVPMLQQDAVRRAVLAACEMMRTFRGIAESWQREHGVQVGMGIGINQGEVIAGNIGSPTYMSYTIIGDTVNVAARLTDAARTNEIVVAEPMMPVLRKLLPALEKETTQQLTLKGKTMPVRIYRIGFERLVDVEGRPETMKPRVMVIDDSEDMRLLVAQYIAMEWPGAQVEGWDPVEKGRPGPDFDWSRFDVVVLDYQLGEENGMEWLQRFCRNPACPPVVFFSGVGDERLAVDAMKHGAADYIAKRDLSRARVVESVGAAMTRGVQRRSQPSPEPAAVAPAPGGDGEMTTEIRIPGFRCLRKLGRGGMSSLYLAERLRDRLPLVLKILDKSLCGDREMQLRFIREAGIFCSIASPYVVRLHDQGISGSLMYIAMEYLGGGDLKTRIRDGIAPDQALRYLVELARALEAIHRAGVVHRDLKPLNVMFREDGSLVLIDFGISKSADEAKPLTQQGRLHGTPNYLSPEQAQGRPADARSDLYSLGVVFYEMLTGGKLFSGEGAMAVIEKHVREPAPSLPAELSAYQPVLDRLLAKDPEERYQSAAGLLQAVDKEFGAAYRNRTGRISLGS